MSDEIEEISNTIDSLIVETALNTAHLKALTLAFHAPSEQLLKEDDFKNMQSHYYNTLFEKSQKLLNSEGLLKNQAKAHRALFELQSFVRIHLKET